MYSHKVFLIALDYNFIASWNDGFNSKFYIFFLLHWRAESVSCMLCNDENLSVECYVFLPAVRAKHAERETSISVVRRFGFWRLAFIAYVANIRMDISNECSRACVLVRLRKHVPFALVDGYGVTEWCNISGLRVGCTNCRYYVRFYWLKMNAAKTQTAIIACFALFSFVFFSLANFMTPNGKQQLKVSIEFKV